MQKTTLGCLGSYDSLIRSFLEKGYRTVFFDELNSKSAQLILRHDVDFDCEAALDLARVESKLGVKSTYFFLVTSDSYNLFSPVNRDAVLAIEQLGHRIEIHFDPTVYRDPDAGLEFERSAFESAFKVRARILSIHRPSSTFLESKSAFESLEHTYLAKYFRDVKYVSDSRGAFRFGHPLETEAFASGKTIHLLTHPIWWVLSGTSNQHVLSNMVAQRQIEYANHVGRNCIPIANTDLQTTP